MVSLHAAKRIARPRARKRADLPIGGTPVCSREDGPGWGAAARGVCREVGTVPQGCPSLVRAPTLARRGPGWLPDAKARRGARRTQTISWNGVGRTPLAPTRTSCEQSRGPPSPDLEVNGRGQHRRGREVRARSDGRRRDGRGGRRRRLTAGALPHKAGDRWGTRRNLALDIRATGGGGDAWP